MSTAIRTCLFSGSYCTVHRGRKITGNEDTCTKAATLMKGIGDKTCKCTTRFSAGQGFVLNPRYERTLQLKLVDPKAIAFVNGQARAVHTAVINDPALEVCATCAELLPATVSLHGNAGTVKILVRKGELALVQNELKQGPAVVARKIAHGEPMFTGNTRGEGELRQTECVVHANDPLMCSCGGWGDWAVMRAMLMPGKPGKPKIFAFGLSCAEAIKTTDASLRFASGTYGEEFYKAGVIDFIPQPRTNTVPLTPANEFDLSKPKHKGSKKDTWEERNAKRNGPGNKKNKGKQQADTTSKKDGKNKKDQRNKSRWATAS